MKKFFAILSLLVLLGAGCSYVPPHRTTGDVGGSTPDADWIKVSDFSGFQTKSDPSKITDGANPNGQNTVINDGDRISIRDYGYTIVGAASSTPNYVHSLHTFRKRSGENIMLRASGSIMEYYEEGNDTWEILKSGLSAGTPFGFADFNINTDLTSYVYFGNGVDNFSRWTGAHTMTNGAAVAAAASITVDDTTGFPASGTIIYCGTQLAYSSLTATTFVVASAHECADNRGVALIVNEDAANPKGNIYLAANNRLFISGVASTTQAVFFSQYGVANTFASTLVTASTAASPGIFNLGEGGGGVTGMALEEGSIYIFKKSIIYKATLSDSLYTLQPLKPFDGKSQTTGLATRGSVFTGGNGVFFTTADKQIMNLSRIDSVDYPQITPISDPIKPTVASLSFTSSTGITWQDEAYFAQRSGVDITANDSVFVYNQAREAWESPIVGWPVSVFTIYDDGTGEALYFGDATQAQVYKVTQGALDNTLGVTANWRSKQFDFGKPHLLKEVENFYVEGYITDNTTLSVSLLCDEDGNTQIYTTNFVGTESEFVINGDPFNLFGFHPFGFERFGSGDQEALKKFRVYLNKSMKRVPCYNFQVEFASDGENQSWEITQFAFKVREFSQPERSSIYRVFN